MLNSFALGSDIHVGGALVKNKYLLVSTSVFNGSLSGKGYLHKDRYYRGLNQQSYDLGLDHEHLQNPDKIERHLDKLDKSFTLVLIMEKFEECLVLMANMLGIPLEQVKSLPINVVDCHEKVSCRD